MDEQKQGEQKPWLDLNHNGVPDYEEGWFWAGAWSVVSWVVRTFAAPHTLAYRGVAAAEQYRATCAGAQGER